MIHLVLVVVQVDGGDGRVVGALIIQWDVLHSVRRREKKGERVPFGKSLDISRRSTREDWRGVRASGVKWIPATPSTWHYTRRQRTEITTHTSHAEQR